MSRVRQMPENDRAERVRFVIDAYLIGVERGIDYQRRFPEDTEVRPPSPLLRCGCWLCKAEDVGRETGRRAVLDGAR